MNKKSFFIYFTLICVFCIFSFQSIFSQTADSYEELLRKMMLDKCTVVVVGKKASTDGSVISTHTCDCGVCDWTWRYIPAKDHEPGTMRKIYHFEQFRTTPPDQGLHWDMLDDNYTGFDIPEVPHTYGYLHGQFGYMNDNQVAIGESTIGNREEIENRTPTPKFDITMLTRIAMERAKTARHAIQIMGELSEKHGYGGVDTGEMLSVSDPNEVWIFEVMSVGPLWTPETGKPGAIWCAQRVPDDHVSVCPNEPRIGEIDLDNKDYFMASPNVMSFAEEMGFWDPKSGEPFNWKKVYAPSNSSAANTNGFNGRLWRFLDLVAPSKKFSAETPNYDLPFSVKPDKKVSLEDVLTILRDKYQDTPYYTARGLHGGPFENPNRIPYGFTYNGQRYNLGRMIGVNRAECTAVTQCRDWLPNPIGGIVWIAFGAQDTGCFMPFYIGVNRIPRSFEIGDHWEFDRRSARWASDYVDFHTQVVYSYAIQDVRKAQEKWETDAVRRTKDIDEHALKLHKKSEKEAREYLTDYCNNNADLVINAWWKLGDDLLVKYNKFWIYDVKERRRLPLQYPEWWLKELIRYNNLKPQPPREGGH